MNVLFICTHNRWRSRTAEDIFKSHPGWKVRSAGTSMVAVTKVSAKLVQWADIIYVMEPKHQQILTTRFFDDVLTKRIECLDIPDEFVYMDPELIELLKDRI